jgi:hypothetical protein
MKVLKMGESKGEKGGAKRERGEGRVERGKLKGGEGRRRAVRPAYSTIFFARYAFR